MAGRWVAGVAAAVALALTGSPLAQAQRPERPSLDDVAAAIVVDARDGTPILEKNPRAQRSIASTTKLMTALLTLERAPFDAVYTAADYRAAAASLALSSIRASNRSRTCIRSPGRRSIFDSAAAAR